MATGSPLPVPIPVPSTRPLPDIRVPQLPAPRSPVPFFLPFFYDVAFAALRHLPLGAVRRLAGPIGDLCYLALGERRRILLGNLRLTAPTASEMQRKRLARHTFRNLIACQIDSFRLPSASKAELQAWVSVENFEYFEAALAVGKGVIVVTPHFGAYDLGGAWLASLGYPVHAMVEDLAPEMLDAVNRIRSATGMKVISRNKGVLSAYRLLKQKEILILVADRVIGDGAGAVEVPFASGIRPVPTGPAAFSISSGAPIIVGHVKLNPGGRTRYLVSFHPPIIPTADRSDDRETLTRLIVDQLASEILRHPDQWFVFQPQWVSRDR